MTEIQTTEHTDAPELPEVVGATVEISVHELTALRAQASVQEPEASTREKSPIKPQDHKLPRDVKQTVEYGGVTFEVAPKAFNKLSTLDLLERGMINTAIRRVVGDDAYDEFLEKNPDADEAAIKPLLEALTNGSIAPN